MQNIVTNNLEVGYLIILAKELYVDFFGQQQSFMLDIPARNLLKDLPYFVKMLVISKCNGKGKLAPSQHSLHFSSGICRILYPGLKNHHNMLLPVSQQQKKCGQMHKRMTSQQRHVIYRLWGPGTEANSGMPFLTVVPLIHITCNSIHSCPCSIKTIKQIRKNGCQIYCTKLSTEVTSVNSQTASNIWHLTLTHCRLLRTGSFVMSL